MKMKNDFNEFRFKGLDYRKFSNKYLTMKRVSEDEKALDYSEYVEIAKEQINNQVQWAIH